MSQSIRMRLSKNNDKLPSFDELSKFLTNMAASYKNFLKINLQKKGYTDISDNFLDAYSSLEISSFDKGSIILEFAPPEEKSKSVALFESGDEILEEIKNTFSYFKKDVVEISYVDEISLGNIKIKYNESERRKIYGKYFNAVANGVDIEYYGDNSAKKNVYIPEEYLKQILLPTKKKAEKSTHSVMVYAEVDEDGEVESKNHKKNIKKIHGIIDTSFDFIKGDGCYYELNQKIVYSVQNVDDYFVLSNDSFGIVSIGQTIEEAKKDFQNYFNFLYHNYGCQNDDKLTKKAKEFKKLINSSIKKIYT